MRNEYCSLGVFYYFVKVSTGFSYFLKLSYLSKRQSSNMKFIPDKLFWCTLIGVFSATSLWGKVYPDTCLVHFSIPFVDQYSATSVIVPFNNLGGLIVVKARVNHIEGNFILDTGASGLVLNNRYFEPDRLSSDLEGIGLSGATSELGEITLDSFSVDELIFEKAYAQTIDLQQLELRKKTKIFGLIGYDLLKNYEIMFDYRARFLTFSQTDRYGHILTPLPHTFDKVDSLDFVLGNHIPVIEVKVFKKKKRMGIDTGAEHNLLNIKRSKNILSNFKVLKTIEITGTSNKKVDALAGRLYRLSIKERYKCAGMSTVLVNMRHLEKIYQTKLDGILGYEFLAPWLFSINYKKQRIFMHKLEFVSP